MRTNHLTLEELERHHYANGHPDAAFLGRVLDADDMDREDTRQEGYQEGYADGERFGYETGYEAGEDAAAERAVSTPQPADPSAPSNAT